MTLLRGDRAETEAGHRLTDTHRDLSSLTRLQRDAMQFRQLSTGIDVRDTIVEGQTRRG